jgi:hypothetical protein
VGWYPQNDFVHVDLGPLKQWGHAETKRKWVGVNDDEWNHSRIRTDANRYSHHAPVLITISPGPVTGDFNLDLSQLNSPRSSNGTWTLERFDRGIWKTTYTDYTIPSNSTVRIPVSTLDLLPRGRYRFRLGNDLSNEFYLKN